MNSFQLNFWHFYESEWIWLQIPTFDWLHGIWAFQVASSTVPSIEKSFYSLNIILVSHCESKFMRITFWKVIKIHPKTLNKHNRTNYVMCQLRLTVPAHGCAWMCVLRTQWRSTFSCPQNFRLLIRSLVPSRSMDISLARSLSVLQSFDMNCFSFKPVEQFNIIGN